MTLKCTAHHGFRYCCDVPNGAHEEETAMRWSLAKKWMITVLMFLVLLAFLIYL